MLHRPALPPSHTPSHITPSPPSLPPPTLSLSVQPLHSFPSDLFSGCQLLSQLANSNIISFHVFSSSHKTRLCVFFNQYLVHLGILFSYPQNDDVSPPSSSTPSDDVIQSRDACRHLSLFGNTRAGRITRQPKTPPGLFRHNGEERSKHRHPRQESGRDDVVRESMTSSRGAACACDVIGDRGHCDISNSSAGSCGGV